MSQSTPLREFVRYSALSSCGMIAVSCYILADTFFVAQGLGTAGLAALNLAIPIYNFIHGTGLMLGMGGATKYSSSEPGKPGGASRMFTGMLFCPSSSPSPSSCWACSAPMGSPSSWGPTKLCLR